MLIWLNVAHTSFVPRLQRLIFLSLTEILQIAAFSWVFYNRPLMFLWSRLQFSSRMEPDEQGRFGFNVQVIEYFSRNLSVTMYVVKG